MFKKRVLSAILGLTVATTLLAGCGGGAKKEAGKAGEGKTTVLKVAFNQPETHPQFQALKKMGEEMKKRTNGKYTIEVFPNELLGAQKETMEMVQSGTIAMSVVGGPLLESWNPDFVVFNLPYMFKSMDEQKKVFTNPKITKDLFNSLSGKGILVKAAFTAGSRNVYLKGHAVKTPADLKGMKIKVMQSETNLKMMELMGGVGTPMGQGEVYTAIQTGVIDGGENNELIYSDLKHCEIAPYYSYTRHLMIPDYLIISKDVYEKLPADVKKIFDEELAKAVESEFKMFNDNIAKAKAKAEKAGAKFNDVDMDAFMKAVAPLTKEKLKTDLTKKLYKEIRALD